MKKEGFEETPLTTGSYDDRWYTKPTDRWYDTCLFNIAIESAIWQARYMIRFLESAIDFVGAAATATGRAADDLRCNRLVNLWLNL